MDRILLKGIEFYGYHGLIPEEKTLGGWYQVDVEVFKSLKKAGDTDKIKDTVDYPAIYKKVVEVGTGGQFQLLERLAHRIAEEILRSFEINEIVVRVRKPAPPLIGKLDYVEIEVRRKKEDFDL
jgi:dihydroneopterin aldolase